MNTRPSIRLHFLRLLDKGLIPVTLIVLFLSPAIPAVASRLKSLTVFSDASIHPND